MDKAQISYSAEINYAHFSARRNIIEGILLNIRNKIERLPPAESENRRDAE